jgi:hypothetical protein
VEDEKSSLSKKLVYKFYLFLFIGKKSRSAVLNYFQLIKDRNMNRRNIKFCFKKVVGEICGKLLAYHNNTTSSLKLTKFKLNREKIIIS